MRLTEPETLQDNRNVDDDGELTRLVRAAQQGDRSAFGKLVSR